MPNLPFVKVYCTAEQRDQVAELARLTGLSSSELVKHILDEFDFQTRLHDARTAEAHRLAVLRESATGGQADLFTGPRPGKGTGGRQRLQAARPRPQGKRRVAARRKRAGKRSGGGR